MSRTAYNRLALFACFLTLSLIVLGVWVRLTHAGLGCPDWPGCYGHLTWPSTPEMIAMAEQVRAERAVDVGYAAGILGIIVLLLHVLVSSRAGS